MKNGIFSSADILLPDFKKVDGTAWAVVACDQFTSEPAYWERAEKLTEGKPSALNLILPEVYLKEAGERFPIINRTMHEYRRDILVNHPDSMIYLERTQSDGTIRRGIIGKVDLEAYDYRRGTDAGIRATEGTVLERIPPRVAIRREAELELPHIMVLIDDPGEQVIEPLTGKTEAFEKAYDFDLMLGGGHVRAWYLDDAAKKAVDEALVELTTPEQMEAKYGDRTLPPLPFAVGDGNHSLAAAKEAYNLIKAQIGEEAARVHPARYALVEIVNLHDAALKFEPIYRVVFGADRVDLLGALRTYAASLEGEQHAQKVTCLFAGGSEEIAFAHPTQQLTVGTLQAFLDTYLASHPGVGIDYIHGEASVRTLSERPDAVGFLFDGMAKDQLFKTVIYDGALPRKTFSMGHAEDKRYYLEARSLK